MNGSPLRVLFCSEAVRQLRTPSTDTAREGNGGTERHGCKFGPDA